MGPYLLSGGGGEAVARAVGSDVALDLVPARPPGPGHAVPDDSPAPGHCPDESVGLEDGDRPGQGVPVDSVLAGEVGHAGQFRPGFPFAAFDTSAELGGDVEISRDPW